MSNYMFMLENHLSPAQSRALAAVQEAAAEANLNLFLAGGAMRDMLGGFPIRDLDFVVEGNGIKLARTLAQRPGVKLISADETRRDAEMLFSGNVTVQIGSCRQEKYPKPGGKPQIIPASIHDHLRSRDFTVNATALSLSRASRGLLLDPTNGLADLEQKQLRAISNYTLYDQPIRMFRMFRLKVRLGFEIADKTKTQYENARAAGVEKYITPEALAEEMRRAASEPSPADVLQVWAQEGLLTLVSSALSGPKLNLAGFQKLQKARQLIPSDAEIAVDDVALFFHVLLEKLTPRERTELLHALRIDRAEAERWQRLEGRAKKLEKELASPELQKPSHIYRVLSKAPAELAVFLLIKPAPRTVQDRIRNYFQKYLPAAQEVTDQQVRQAGGVEGTPKFEKLRNDLIAKRLDARPKRPPEAPAVPPPVTAPKPRFTFN